MIYAYRRMSTGQQDGEGQGKKILEFAEAQGLKIDEWSEETISSRVHRRDRDVSRLISALQPGDTLVVSELSRLARSMSELMMMVAEIREAGASLAIAESGRVISQGDGWEADVYLMSAAISAQIEREMISQRTKAALRARKNAGVILGRPAGTSKLTARQSEIEAWQKIGLNNTAIAKLLGVARSTLNNYLKQQKVV